MDFSYFFKHSYRHHDRSNIAKDWRDHYGFNAMDRIQLQYIYRLLYCTKRAMDGIGSSNPSKHKVLRQFRKCLMYSASNVSLADDIETLQRKQLRKLLDRVTIADKTRNAIADFENNGRSFSE